MLFGSRVAYVKKKADPVAAVDDAEEFDEEDLAAGLSSRTPAFAMGMGMSGALGTPAMAAGAAMAAPMPASAEHADRRRRSSREDADVVERESSGRGMAGGVFGRLFGRFGSTSSAPAVSADAAPAMMPTSMPPPRPRKMRREEDGPRRVFRREVDTNVVSLQLGSLANVVSVATGDAVPCGGATCGAYLSVRSVVLDRDSKRVRGPVAENPAEQTAAVPAPVAAVPAPAPVTAVAGAGDGAGAGAAAAAAAPAAVPAPPTDAALGAALAALGDGEYLWVCEFCRHHNVITVFPEELPVAESVDYIEAAAPAVSGAGLASEDTSNVIFCIDISGSMCVSTLVEGSMQLKGDHRRDMRALIGAGDAGDQYMPGERRGGTYVTRLQSVQAAISSQIETLKLTSPARRVGLVVFNGDVTIYGDCSRDPRVIAGDNLSNYDALVAAGTEYLVEQPVSVSGDALLKKVFELEETGPTALGPAVLVSVAMASRTAGGKIVVCTDGLANVGLGAMDEESVAAATASVPGDAAADDSLSPSEQFYSRVGAFAATSGLAIDVVGIVGDGCNLEVLGTLSEATGGSVINVNPLELTKNFSSILAKAVLASNVSVKLLLHFGMQFRNEAGVTGNKLTREVGNVTDDTEFSFEYSARPLSELPPGALEGLTELPFQVQIRFTRRDGMKCIRCITHCQPVTEDRAVAEGMLEAPVIASHAQQQCARMALSGGYQQSRVNAMAFNELMSRNLRTVEDVHAYTTWTAQAVEMESALREEETEERMLGLHADEADYGSAAPLESSKMRKERRTKKDKLSSVLRSKTSAAAFSPMPTPSSSAAAMPAPSAPTRGPVSAPSGLPRAPAHK